MIRAIRAISLAMLIGVLGLSMSPAQDKTTKTDKKIEKKTDSKTDPKTEKKTDKKTTGTSAVFEMYVDSAGEYRFRLKDADGLLLASSGKGYKTKADCQKTIDAIQKDAAKAKIDDQTK